MPQLSHVHPHGLVESITGKGKKEVMVHSGAIWEEVLFHHLDHVVVDIGDTHMKRHLEP
jgi:hypothetical protein